MTALDATPAPLDATTRVRTLIALTEELSAIFAKENAALRARRPRDIAPLQTDKARLAAAYAQSIRSVAADRSVVSGAGDALMEQLRTLTKDFETRAAEQRLLLDSARFAAEGVLKAVADEAGAAKESPAYGGPTGAATAAPIAVNEEA